MRRLAIAALAGAAALALAALVSLTVGSATASGRGLANRSTSDPRALAVQIVQWNFLHQYGRVWQALDPRFQKVTTRAFWQSCKEKNGPAAITMRSLKAIDSYSDAMTLPVVGHVKVEAVTLQLKFTTPALSGVQTVTDTVYFTRYRGTWKGLWTQADYQAYSHHRCPAN